MPRYHIAKKSCGECERHYSGVHIGTGEKNQPFIFYKREGADSEIVFSKLIEMLADDSLELRDQWLNIHEKELFIKQIDENKNINLTTAYYEEEYIKQNKFGYLYSNVDLNLR